MHYVRYLLTTYEHLCEYLSLAYIFYIVISFFTKINNFSYEEKNYGFSICHTIGEGQKSIRSFNQYLTRKGVNPLKSRFLKNIKPAIKRMLVCIQQVTLDLFRQKIYRLTYAALSKSKHMSYKGDYYESKTKSFKK